MLGNSKKMNLKKIHELSFEKNETILTATLSNANELVMLLSSGSVIRHQIKEGIAEHLFSVKNDLVYSDGGFDSNAKSTIYTMDEIVVVVNDYKRHGFVHYPGKYHALHLWREDYGADISAYPIALFKSQAGVPHLIFAEAWNHVQIMNLDTRQVLTAAKSLIEVGAEEWHIEFFKKYTEDNKLPWPRPYDYFFGKLLLSPNQTKFMSAGWIWGSFDKYNVYDIEQFIGSNRITDMATGVWEHENRAACWIDDETIAIAYDPFTDDEENSNATTPHEIHLYKIEVNTIEIDKKLVIADTPILKSNMYYDQTSNCFVTFSEKNGLSIISAVDGSIIFKVETITINEYNREHRLLLANKDNIISIYELAETED